MSSSVAAFDELLGIARHTAVHLEMRDVYAVDYEHPHFTQWRETGIRTIDPMPDYFRHWVDLIRRTVARGVTVRRARIVSEPVSEYIRYEHAGTPINLAAGERVCWLPRRRASDLALPGNDFWLIDRTIVRWNHFTGEGASAGGEMSDDMAVVTLCATAFEAVWKRAVPHAEYEIR
ncbi:hypothetical protein SRB5_32060 [Streptomyces sp. RB5]|uniref:DUF6879 domain-containing protein n=1 Tax=Streptomyces smaragdinus TaxID=2585196 RepID=A0A7K0CI12_9ACTN|nr:DUF6879 family protein [Streptomyces smaragdinus]MQY13066.1 hypothetical protein [Streptomyces smaragdinus]